MLLLLILCESKRHNCLSSENNRETQEKHAKKYINWSEFTPFSLSSTPVYALPLN